MDDRDRMRTDFVGVDGMCGWIPAIEIQIDRADIDRVIGA